MSTKDKADGKKREEFLKKLKYGKHWNGTTTFGPGQTIKVIKGKIHVR